MEMGRVDLGRVVLVPISPEFVLFGAVLVVGRFFFFFFLLFFFVSGRLSGIIWYHESILRRPLQIEITRSTLMAPLPSVLFFLITSADELHVHDSVYALSGKNFLQFHTKFTYFFTAVNFCI